MTRLELMQLSQGLSDLYTEMETDLLANIAAFLTAEQADMPSAQWKIQMLAQLGALDRKNLRTITQYVKNVPRMLQDTLQAGVLSALEDLEPGFRQMVLDGILQGTDTPVEDTMARALKAYARQARKSMNMVNTVMRYKARDAAHKAINDTAELADKQEFLNVLNKAAGKTVSGIESRQAAMRQCIKEMTDKGIPAFVDKRGREWSPEAYVNMAIRTTAANTAQQAQFDRMDDYGLNLVEVSSHSGARPKCAKDQGKIFNRSGGGGYTTDLHGRKIRYYAWSESSYGEPDGILGINCGHQIYPFTPGVSYQTYFPEPEEENAEAYKKSQQQRELERRVRKSKRECMMLETAGDPEGARQAQQLLKQRQDALRQFCGDNGLRYKPDRTAVVGYNRTISGEVRKSLTSSAKGGTIEKRPYEILKPRKKRLEIINRGISEEKPIFAVDTDINRFASYVKNVKPKDGFYDVALHGSPTSTEFFGEDIDAYTLAVIIRNRKDYISGTKVRLLSCSTGNTDETGDCFAQILANELGIEVEAPTKDILVYQDGAFDIGEKNDGEMKIFYSRK